MYDCMCWSGAHTISTTEGEGVERYVNTSQIHPLVLEILYDALNENVW